MSLIGVLLGVLLVFWAACEFAPKFMVRRMSNPFSCQVRWIVGRKAFRFQTLTLVAYHKPFNFVLHVVTFHAESVLWLCVAYGLSPYALYAAVLLPLHMALCTHSFLMTMVALLYWAAASTLAVWCVTWGGVTLTHAAAAIIVAGTLRTVAHSFDVMPPHMFFEGGFRENAMEFVCAATRAASHPPQIAVMVCEFTSLFVIGAVTEICVGLPFRLVNSAMYLEVMSLCPSLVSPSEEGKLHTLADYRQAAEVFVSGGWQAHEVTRDVLNSGDYSFDGWANLNWAPEGPQWLPRFWYWLFLAELPLCTVTAIMWMAKPDLFLRGVYGIEHPTPPERALLHLPANVTFSAYVWFYGRMLLQKEQPDARCMRMLQEAMLIGDCWIVMSSLYTVLNSIIVPGDWVMFGSQIVLASLFGLARVVFLATVHPPSSRGASVEAPSEADTQSLCTADGLV
eukprot:TRINITY_DN9894_c0_g1_i2.p1 TRINITY_DN9894_c0_g1~~TRINITY_DN9894_c0_g1_i2.p1  ORF type:complete len:452 (+),score=82.71 TRINITY_DN9894_c0_g1_i2:46-1401(+)